MGPQDARGTPFSMGPSIIGPVGDISQSLAFHQPPSSNFTTLLRSLQPFLPTRRWALLSPMVKPKLKGSDVLQEHQHSYAGQGLDLKNKNPQKGPPSLERRAG